MGTIPLDRGDEGLESVDVTMTLAQIYSFFENRIAEYEIKLAADYFSPSNT